MESGHHLLICTVGGTRDGVIASINKWKPARVLFVPSKDTEKQIEDIIQQKSDPRVVVSHEEAEATTKQPPLLRPGEWDAVPINDAQDFRDCVRRMRSLGETVEDWVGRGPDYRIIVDFTAGTKCMSAAMASVARRWRSRFSYVGGVERTKGGVGVVVSGRELILHHENPWNALGYQAIEDACLLFDQQAFMPAASLLDEVRKATDDASIKRTLSTFHRLCEAYGRWDQFQHADALERIKEVLKNRNDLEAEFGATRSDRVLSIIQQNLKNLEDISQKPQSRAMVGDLLANAGRRGGEGRWDDAVARLYRAIESLAQLALAERHGIPHTDNVALESIPESLRERWKSRTENGTLRLGVQDAYELLDGLGDEGGKMFKDLKLDNRERSPLTARNQSILAHGFAPVGEGTFKRLWDAATKLGGFSEQELPVFPSLAKPGSSQ